MNRNPADDGQRSHRAREALAATAVAALAIGWGLGAERFVGDELNALHFMRDSLGAYLRDFHYDNAIKIQFWWMHRLFGNDMAGWRLPAAMSGVVACACLFLPRIPVGARWAWPASCAAVLLAFNAEFLRFARWGMPDYAEGIAASALLLALLLRQLLGGRWQPRWSWPQLLCIVVLPWLYPATIVLLGGLTAYLGLAVVARHRGALVAGAFLRDAAIAGVPLLLGGLNCAAHVLSRPVEDFARARAHHMTFPRWHQRTGGDWGDYFAYAADHLGRDFVQSAVASSGDGAAAVFQWLAGGLWMMALAAIATAAWLAWSWRSSADTDPAVAGLARGLRLVGTVFLATLLVTFAASLPGAFPAGSIRYVFFLLPAGAFAVLLSIALVGLHVGRHLRARARLSASWVLALVLLATAATGTASLARQRSASGALEGALAAQLASPDNLAVVTWEPGFFMPAQLLASGTPLFRMARGRRIPGALGAVLADPGDRSTITVLGRTATMFDRSGSLLPSFASFVERLGYAIDRRMDASPYTVLVLARERSGGARRARSATVEFTLPAGAIRRVRIQPTALRGGQVRLDPVVYAEGTVERVLDLCADGRLQRVRTRRLFQDADGACVFEFGTKAGSGWIGPSALRALPASGVPRRLRLHAEGALGLSIAIYVYLDPGGRVVRLQAPVGRSQSP